MISHFFIGLVMSYVGLLPPGMMNMTVVRHSLTSGLKPAYKFSAGAATIVAIQSLIALSFAQLLLDNPQIIRNLRKAAVFVFIALGIYFFRLAKKEFVQRDKKSRKNLYAAGIIMSSMNMLAIPFFFGYSTLMNMKGWLLFEFPEIYSFVIGAVTGSFFLFVTYAQLADFVSRKVGFLAKNINYILAILFVILAIITFAGLIKS